jgi:hypothetical protein
MRKAINASALILALACTTHAGDMQNGVAGTTPTPTPQSVTQEAQTPVGDTPDGDPDYLTEAVLTVVESVLALL